MKIPPTENRFQPFISVMTSVLLILAGTAACVADFINLYVLDRPPAAQGVLILVIGLLGVRDEIEKPRKGRNRPLLIIFIVLAAGGAVLQIFGLLSRLP